MKKRILIVDDIYDNIKVAMNFLKNDNYELYFATSGQEAIQRVQTIKPNLILMDVMMPDMSGFEAIQILKDELKIKNLLVIFLTAKTNPSDVEEGFKVGGVDYITKPFSNLELNARVRNHLELDDNKKWLYFVDGGNQRILRLDITTGTTNGAPSWGPQETLAEYQKMTGFSWEEVVTTGLTQPAGIDIIDNHLVVTDYYNGDIVFYASDSTSIDVDGVQNMEEIFIYASDNGNPVIVLASDATKYIDPESKSIYLRLKDGVRYQGLPSSENINILNFDSYDLEIVSGEVQKSIATFTEIEEKTTLDLLKQGGLLAIAELQWRLSLPLSILILVVFAVYLGKTSPRGGKGINILIGIFVFMLYNNGLLVAKSSIENGLLSPIIGMWSIHLIAILFLILLYQFRQGKIMYFIDKITIFNNKKKSHV